MGDKSISTTTVYKKPSSWAYNKHAKTPIKQSRPSFPTTNLQISTLHQFSYPRPPHAASKVTTTHHYHIIKNQTRYHNPIYHCYNYKRSRHILPIHSRNTVATRALTPTIRAAHISTHTSHHTETLRRHGHGPGSPTQSGIPRQNIRIGGYIPGCTYMTPAPNHTNEREIPPPTTPLFHHPI